MLHDFSYDQKMQKISMGLLISLQKNYILGLEW